MNADPLKKNRLAIQQNLRAASFNRPEANVVFQLVSIRLQRRVVKRRMSRPPQLQFVILN